MFHVPGELCSQDIPARVTTDNTGVRSSLPSTSRTLTTYSYLSFAIPFFLWLLLHISFSHLPNPLSVTPYRQVITYGENTFFRNDGTPKRRLNTQILGLHKHCSQKPKPYITDHFFLFISFFCLFSMVQVTYLLYPIHITKSLLQWLQKTFNTRQPNARILKPLTPEAESEA
jgi:hypothetical protein